MKNLKTLLLLHVVLMIYSLADVCSKLAAGESLLSLRFVLFYGGMVLFLGAYAVAWQQVIKRMDLTAAYANRAVTVLWGIVWGLILFHETLNPLKVLGAAIIVAGVVLFEREELRDE